MARSRRLPPFTQSLLSWKKPGFFYVPSGLFFPPNCHKRCPRATCCRRPRSGKSGCYHRTRLFFPVLFPVSDVPVDMLFPPPFRRLGRGPLRSLTLIGAIRRFGNSLLMKACLPFSVFPDGPPSPPQVVHSLGRRALPFLFPLRVWHRFSPPGRESTIPLRPTFPFVPQGTFPSPKSPSPFRRQVHLCSCPGSSKPRRSGGSSLLFFVLHPNPSFPFCRVEVVHHGFSRPLFGQREDFSSFFDSASLSPPRPFKDSDSRLLFPPPGVPSWSRVGVIASRPFFRLSLESPSPFNIDSFLVVAILMAGKGSPDDLFLRAQLPTDGRPSVCDFPLFLPLPIFSLKVEKIPLSSLSFFLSPRRCYPPEAIVEGFTLPLI